MNREPTFVGVGSQKCGSSSVSLFLEQSGATVPQKELHYDFGPNSTKEDYLRLFGKTNELRVFGEFTPDYVYHTSKLHRLGSFLTTTKFLVILRDPVDRFYSAVNHGRAVGSIPLRWTAKRTLVESMNGKLNHHWIESLVWKGFHGEHLSRALRLLPSDRVWVAFLEDLSSPISGEGHRVRLLDFVGLDKGPKPRDFPKVNTFSERLSGKFPVKRDAEVDTMLRKIYRPSMEILRELVGRDLPWRF